jgi:putative holliday junction resolvase
MAPADGQPQLILAFDYGTRRIGVAAGDTLTCSARALTTLEYPAGKLPWAAIDALVADLTPAQFVVGLPYNMDGSPATLAAASRNFAGTLKARYARAVVLVDERLSSREAEEILRSMRAQGLKRSRVRAADVDSAAAAVVLGRWFESPGAGEKV